ncbi:high mobility group protein 20A-like [Lineus longissimus]|uniref:high mobility group protein 20A-like n=1 Tax=Lineus longissimus TaxID=88925 RepID=UPI002B4EF805
MPSSATLDALLVNGTIYTLTSTSDTGHSELVSDKIVLTGPAAADENKYKDSSISCATSNLDAHSIEVDTASGMVCMKVGNTVYQMPLCGVPPAALDIATGQLLSSHDSVLTSQGNNFLELSIADPATDTDTGQTLPPGQNLPDLSKLVPIEEPSSSGQDTNTMNKRKGGWPKGKRRKPEIGDKNAPKAPTTGYVLFAIERRKILEDENPQLFFPEITKMLGSEWSALPAKKKQKYLDEAEADKKRYIEELKAYQQSDAYQNFVKKKKLNGHGNSLDGGTSNSVIDLDEDDGLCCKVCDKYFNSLHNKKEHMFGKLHLQRIKGEYELEQYNSANQKQNDNLIVPSSRSTPVESAEEKHENTVVDLDSFIQEFMEKNMERELEIKALKDSLQAASELNTQYGKQITEIRDLDTKLEQDLATMKAYGTSLNAQIDMLKMVPTLFGVINF